MNRLLALLLALGTAAQAADPAPAPVDRAPDRGPAAAPPQRGKLPPGAIRRGTLANPNLLADVSVGVTAAAGTLGIAPIEKALPYVTALPRGAPGSRSWKERWIVSRGNVSATIDIRFAEDGAGGATWSIEVPQADAEQKHYVAAAQEFVRQAQAGNVDGMIAATSSVTVRNSDPRQLAESYRQFVVPRFKDATVTWADAHTPATDDSGNHGWDVDGQAEGKESFSFFITVMKENGEYVVVTLGRRKPDDPAR